jgi:hypothetical protein
MVWLQASAWHLRGPDVRQLWIISGKCGRVLRRTDLYARLLLRVIRLTGAKRGEVR